MHLLVTGGAGFIGSNFIHYMLGKYPSYHITNLDALTYAGNLDNLVTLQGNNRYQFVKGDINDAILVDELAQVVDVIINFASETHVDRSIHNAFPFIETNVRGVVNLLAAARKANHRRFIQVSTDEVYGDWVEGGKANESSAIYTNSPYAASKAGGDLQVLAAIATHNFPAIITRCTNNYGPFEHPEKVIPLFILKAINNEPLPLYGDGSQIRDWLYVKDHCSAIDLLLHEGQLGEIYNIAAEQDPEITNLQLAKIILEVLLKSPDLIQSIKDRPGHDRRYAVNASKIRALGWKPSLSFKEGISSTIKWYQENRIWLDNHQTFEFKKWQEKHYGY
jgi:dTDP-glucose 4,6-dehydratase